MIKNNLFSNSLMSLTLTAHSSQHNSVKKYYQLLNTILYFVLQFFASLINSIKTIIHTKAIHFAFIKNFAISIRNNVYNKKFIKKEFKMNKKILSIFALIMALSFAVSCSNEGKSGAGGNNNGKTTITDAQILEAVKGFGDQKYSSGTETLL